MKELDQIWIAGGIGITPFLSLAKYIYTHKVKLFWSVKNNQKAVYFNELTSGAKDNPNFEFTIWASEEKGYLTADSLGSFDFEDKAYLVCWPHTLKENLMKQIKAKGVKQDRIYNEEFTFR